MLKKSTPSPRRPFASRMNPMASPEWLSSPSRAYRRLLYVGGLSDRPRPLSSYERGEEGAGSGGMGPHC
jgi:hypothetical protein